MKELAIVSGSVSFLIFAYIFISNRIRKSKYKNWKVGDIIFLKDESNHELRGWSKDYFYIKTENGGTRQMKWHKFDFNKSAGWRKNWIECKDAMGKDPDFSSHVDLQNNAPAKSTDIYDGDIPPNAMIDGKPILTLTEIECQVYLKQSLAEENYEVAELIKKRMISFR